LQIDLLRPLPIINKAAGELLFSDFRSGAAAPAAAFSQGTRRYVLSILVIAYTFNFIDRQILGILVEPIRLELGVGDTAMGLLTGLAFAVFYTLMGIPIARYADRANRRNLIALAVGVWSLFTAAQGLAQNYWQLLAYRIGVGIGEAGCSPPAHSMLSDYYPANQRATALGIYSMANLWAAFHYWRAGVHFPGDLKRVED